MNERHNINRLFSRLFLALLLLTGSTVCMAEVTEISQAELAQRIKIDSAGLILDVRSAGEYAEGHIPGAVNIPHDQLGSRLNEIGEHRDKEVVLYCRSGKRAGVAAGILESAGFSKLRHLTGDMLDWQGNGNLPVSK